MSACFAMSRVLFLKCSIQLPTQKEVALGLHGYRTSFIRIPFFLRIFTLFAKRSFERPTSPNRLSEPFPSARGT